MEIGVTNDSITSIITSIFIFFIIGCTFFSRYKVIFRRNAEGKIDNKFLAFCEKIAIPVNKFFTILYVNVTNFFKKIINKIAKKEKFEIIDLKKKENEETNEASTVFEASTSTSLAEETPVVENEATDDAKEAIVEENKENKNKEDE